MRLRTVVFWTVRRENPRIFLLWQVDPRCLALGLWWTPRPHRLDIYLCLVPALPVKVSLFLKYPRLRRMREWLGIAPRSVKR